MVPYLSPQVQNIISAFFNVSYILAEILLFRKNRKADGEPGIDPFLGTDTKANAEPVTYFFTQIKPHTCRAAILPAVFSCKSFLKNPGQGFRRNAAAVIPDVQEQLIVSGGEKGEGYFGNLPCLFISDRIVNDLV